METANDANYSPLDDCEPILENQEQNYSYRPVSELTSNRGDEIISGSNDSVEENQHQSVTVDMLLEQGKNAIKNNVKPIRNSKGSSGSYFVRDQAGKYIGVFKPKDEEPYGKLNPKWLKWMHKTCLPCCFGRSCIIPNKGYLSEVGASLVDSFLGLNIVPKTTLAWISSDVFNYSRIERSKMSKLRRGEGSELPEKMGSFQTFMHGYVDSSDVIYKLDKNFYTTKVGRGFLIEFQKMVVLDYLIRNTDRGHENWMVKVETYGGPESNLDTETSPNTKNNFKSIKIAAIDNGMAFPFKHPDGWRLYPYSWAWLRPARYPFHEKVAEQVLPILDDKQAVENMIYELETLFRKDKGFSTDRFNSQMNLMRGQIVNLRDALRFRATPESLVSMDLLYVSKAVEWESARKDGDPHLKNPYFSCI